MLIPAVKLTHSRRALRKQPGEAATPMSGSKALSHGNTKVRDAIWTLHMRSSSSMRRPLAIHPF